MEAEAQEKFDELGEEAIEGEGPAALPNGEEAHSKGNHNEL
jgi:hypothetical protein